MFYSFELLVKRKGVFAIIWQFLHDKRKAIRAKQELMAIDVYQTCETLRDYVPSGKYSQGELSNKMSLYLLAQMLYGITLVHRLQVNAQIDELQEVAKSLMRYQPPEKGRKRSSAAVLEEEDEEEASASGRKRRVSKPAGPIILDLTNPKSYMPEPVREQPVIDPFEQLDDIEGFKVREGDGTLIDWNTVGEGAEGAAQPGLRVSVADIFELPLRGRVSEVSFDYFASPEAARRRTSGHLDVSSLREIVNNKMLQEEAPARLRDLMSPRLSRQSERLSGMEQTQPTIPEMEEEEEEEEFILQPLPAKAPPGTNRRRSMKRVRTYLDTTLLLSENDLNTHATNVNRLLRSKESMQANLDRVQKAAYLSRMTNARPDFLMEMRCTELYPLYAPAQDRVKERPLTFQQAAQLDCAELRIKRRFDFDLISWDSEAGCEPFTPMVPSKEQQKGAVDLSQPHGFSPARSITAESRRRLASPSVDGPLPKRVSSFEPARSERYPTPHLADESFIRPGGPLLEDSYNGLTIATATPLAARASSVPSKEAEVLMGSWAQDLLGRIENKAASSRFGVIQFDAVVGPPTRKDRARDFFALLGLLKHQTIKVKQRVPFQDILIKKRPVREGLKEGRDAAGSDGEDDAAIE